MLHPTKSFGRWPLRGSTGKTHDRRSSARRRILSLEPLESRLVLSTYTVGTLLDVNPPNGLLSLRQAITLANADNATNSPNKPTSQNPDLIQFAAGLSGQISLASALPSITSNIQIQGPGSSSLIVSGNGTGANVFDITAQASGVAISGLTIGYSFGASGVALEAGSSASLTSDVITHNLHGITIQDGASLTVSLSTIIANHSNAQSGAGIYVANFAGTGGTSVTISQSTISGNTTIIGLGAGIYVGPSPSAAPSTLSVTRSTVSGNSAAGDGGGIYVGVYGHASVVESTIANNTAGSDGGGIMASAQGATLSIDGSTIAANTAGLGGLGGGIRAQGAILRDSIVALNYRVTATDPNGNATNLVRSDGADSLDASSSYNLIQDGTGMTGIYQGVNGNQIGTDASPIDPKLGALQDNGGPTFTMALLPGSPVIDRGKVDPSLGSTDQRGLPRVNDIASIPQPSNGDGSDIGAYELNGAPASTILTVNSTADANPPAGVLTLRQAIQAADGTIPLSSLPAGQVSVGTAYHYIINFSVIGQISLGSALPSLSQSIEIDGPGASLLTVSDSGVSANVFDVATHTNGVAISGLTIGYSFGASGVALEAGSSASLTSDVITHNLHGITIQDGASLTVSLSTIIANHSNAQSGAGIYVANFAGTGGTSVTISQSTISGNTTIIGLGAGIYVGLSPSAAPSTLSVTRSTVSGNSAAGDGGGIYVGAYDHASVVDSTVANNTSAGNGGGIAAGATGAALALDGSTVAGNTAGLGSSGGGITTRGGTLRDSIVALNYRVTATDPNGNATTLVRSDVSGTVFNASDHNLIGDGTGMTGIASGVNGNQIGTDTNPIDPKLGALQDNGGPTYTMALQLYSPALNMGSGRSANTNPDQRGVARAVLSNIGAYQATASQFVVVFPSPTTAGKSRTFLVEATDSQGQIAYGYNASVRFSSSDIAAILPPNSGLVAGFGGFTGTLKTAGTQSLTVTDATNSAFTGSQSGIVVNSSAASSIAVSAGNNQSTVVTSSLASPLLAIVKDAFGNPVAGVSVTFTVNASNGAGGSFSGSSTATVITDANGIATALALTANMTAGQFTVKAAITSTSITAATFTTTNTATSSITVDSTPANTALQGDTSGTITLATFNDPNLAPFKLSDYTASIAWGDNSASTGTVSIVNGELAVTGSHTYSGSGSFSTVVTLTHTPTSRTATATDAFTVAPDLAGRFSAVKSGFTYSHATKLYNGTITFTNTSASVLTGTLEIVLAGLPSTVTPKNAAGTTASGLPYLLAKLTTPLAPGQSIRLTVQFSNPSGLLFDYAVRAYGLGNV